jgi:hypothetical protein
MGQTIIEEDFEMRKFISASLLLWLLLILAMSSASAQSPQLTALTGTVYNGDGTTAARGQLLLTRVVKNGVIVATGTRAITADASGNVSFNVLRGARITLKGSVIIGDSDLSQGESFDVPNASSATLESLAAVASVPSDGLTIKLSGSVQANKFGTLDFGSGFTATESPTGELNLSVSAVAASDLPSGIDATKIGAGTVNNTKWGYLANLTSDVQTQLTAKALASDLTSEVNTRASADTTLQSNITSEASTRASADTTLHSNITAEASTRASADAALQASIEAALEGNTPISEATHTKITYDSKGLVTGGVDATTADIADSSDRRYITDAQRTVIQNTSGVNSGDQNLTPYFHKSNDDSDDITEGAAKLFLTTAERTKLSNTSGTNTGDQTSVTGNAGTATALQNARTIDGQSFNGTANITVIAPATHAATGKTTPVDADEVPLVDSAASNVLKRLTWANLKATLKTYFDSLYQAALGFTPENVANKDTDVTLAANSDTKYASQKAVKTYVDASERRLSSTIVNLNSTSAQDLYTVPAGKTLVVTKIAVRSPNPPSIFTFSDLNFIESGGGAPILPVVDVSVLGDATLVYWTMSQSNTQYPLITAGNKAQAQPSAASGTAYTVVVDLFGYLF